MKKLLLSAGVILSALSLSAQTLVNGNFEGTMTAIPGTAYTYSMPGWVTLNTGPETASPNEGTQSAKAVVTNDPALNAALSWGDDIITGLLQQRIAGPVANPSTMEVSFAYKFDKMGTDTAYIEVGIMDTMGAGTNDDVYLYADWLEIPATVANWTNVTLSMQALTGTGTANRFYMIAVASTKGYYDAQTPTVGTTLWLDNVVISNPAGLAEENVNTVNVYPNPATSVLNIDSKEAISSVVVTTTDGKVVSTTNAASVNIESLNAGMYIYQVTSVSGKVSKGNFVKN